MQSEMASDMPPEEQQQTEITINDVYVPAVVVKTEPDELGMTELNGKNSDLEAAVDNDSKLNYTNCAAFFVEACIKEEPCQRKRTVDGVTIDNVYNESTRKESREFDEDEQCSRDDAVEEVCRRTPCEVGEDIDKDTEEDADHRAAQNTARSRKRKRVPQKYVQQICQRNRDILKRKTDSYSNIATLDGIAGTYEEMSEDSGDQTDEDVDARIATRNKKKRPTDVIMTRKQSSEQGIQRNNRSSSKGDLAVRKTSDRVLRPRTKTITKASCNILLEDTDCVEEVKVVSNRLSKNDTEKKARLNPIIKSEDGQDIFECRLCQETFSNLKSYRTHSRHHKDKYMCEICDTRFARKSTYNGHMRQHDGEKPFACHLCEAKFTVSDALSQHLRSCGGRKCFQCPQCDGSFSQKKYLDIHLRSHSTVPDNPIGLTEEEATREARMNPIIKIIDGREIFECRICSKSYSSLKRCKAHSYDHKAKHECAVCHATFSRNSNLKVHMRRHVGEKPFACHLCDLRCSDSSVLTRHLFVHTGEKPFKCSLCNSAFSRRAALNDHMFAHGNVKSFLCSICGARYTHNCNLNTHMKKHAREKQFNCVLCPTKFWETLKTASTCT